MLFLNALALGRCGRNLRWVIFNFISNIDILCIPFEITLPWMPKDLADDESILVQVMAWCRQATSHYLSQCDHDLCHHMASLGHNELIDRTLCGAHWNTLGLKQHGWHFTDNISSPFSWMIKTLYFDWNLKVEYLIICIICDTDLVNKLILQVYTLHKYK